MTIPVRPRETLNNIKTAENLQFSELFLSSSSSSHFDFPLDAFAHTSFPNVIFFLPQSNSRNDEEKRKTKILSQERGRCRERKIIKKYFIYTFSWFSRNSTSSNEKLFSGRAFLSSTVFLSYFLQVGQMSSKNCSHLMCKNN